MCELDNVINYLVNIELSQYVAGLAILVISTLVNKFVISYVFNVLYKLVLKTNNFFDDSIMRALEKPIKFLVFFFGIYYALAIMKIDDFNLDFLTTKKVIRVGIIIAVCYFSYNLTLENSVLYSRMHKKKANTIVFPFISIIIRLIIIVLGISIIAKEFGFAGFITGLGISGVAFALAAQDAFSNLFGGMIIVLDKPFEIGDWIQTDEIEGIVEDITFRSTRVRTFSMAIATVPNSKLANNNIINWTQRELRRIHFKFTIDATTDIEKIEVVIKNIENLLKCHELIDNKLIIVSFNELTTYGFCIFVYFYTNIVDYVKYEKLKQEINIEILKILRNEKVSLMYLRFNICDDKNLKETKDISQFESIKSITEEEGGIE